MAAKEKAEEFIGRFLFVLGIPFHLLRSSFYKQSCKDIYAAGPSFVPVGETKLRTFVLNKDYSKVVILMEDMRQTWMLYHHGWADRYQTLATHQSYCQFTTCSYFLIAIDCTGKRKDVPFQFQILKDAIEEVGPSNVVQVVTDSARVCNLAGVMVESTYRHIFWTPCCVHALITT